jgi:hypothetical protein
VAQFERRETALRMRADGQSFGQIAEALSITRQAAAGLVRRALEAHSAELLKNIAAVRAGEALKLDRLEAAARPGALAGQPRAIETYLKIMERRARLYGLDLQPSAHVEVQGTTYVLVDPFPAPPVVDGHADEVPEFGALEAG